MKLLTIESEAFKKLVRKIDRIYEYVTEQAEKNAALPVDPAGVWVSNDEAAALLEVSTRTLQRLRSSGEITYSIRGGRAWYTLAEIQRVMSGCIIRSKYLLENELLRAHQDYQKRKKTGAGNKPK